MVTHALTRTVPAPRPDTARDRFVQCSPSPANYTVSSRLVVSVTSDAWSDQALLTHSSQALSSRATQISGSQPSFGIMVPSSRQLLLSLVVLTLAVTATPLLSDGVVGSETAVSADNGSEDIDVDDADTATMLVAVDDGGDAEWAIEYRYILDSSDSEEAFEAVQERITENSETYEERFREGMIQTAEMAMEETGREMEVGTVDTTVGTDPIPQASGQYGVISYEFSWDGFAEVGEGALGVGDAISGFYLSEDTALVISWPDSYELAEDPRPSGDDEDSTRVVWEGEERFSSAEPTLTLEKPEETASATSNESDVSGSSGDSDSDTAEDGGAESASDDGATTSTVTESPSSERSLIGIVLALLGVVVVGIASLFVVRSRFSATETDEPAANSLLSNEERVLAALEAEGGRIKQKQLAERCDWHPSKTSKVVTSLKEDDVIDVFRIGRENIITHPDEQLGETNE